MSEAIISGVIVLPKIDITGKFIPQTLILLHKITGSQPCEIQYKGKTIPGMKIYTAEGNFKSPITVQELGQAMATAIHTGTCQTIESSTMKALPAPKKK